MITVRYSQKEIFQKSFWFPIKKTILAFGITVNHASQPKFNKYQATVISIKSLSFKNNNPISVFLIITEISYVQVCI